ncbi:hypothetical protein NDU88_005833 [Pleurodeles waltl]|uniref:Uncharacterized protein n=1 Tax=Pleurodeles waltl TaxID=8319 RepID=A0AAV7LNV9_PLEWA|nr:hypothetical protein NDU88_005833 [Pleurodeles waltl]
MSRRSLPQYNAPRGRGYAASDLRPGEGGMPSGEPNNNNARRPQGPKRGRCVSGAGSLLCSGSRGSVSRSPLFPSPGESGRRTRGQADKVSAARRLCRCSRQRGQRGGSAPLTASLQEARPSVAASPQLEAAARAPATGLRSVLRSPHGISGEIAFALRGTSAPHRL